MRWQPLSRRRGGLEPDGPFEDVPDHLQAPLASWVKSVFQTYDEYQNISTVAVVLRFPVAPGWRLDNIANALLNEGVANDEFFLDLVDATLRVYGPMSNRHRALRETLALAGSAWTVDKDNVSLSRTVSEALAGIAKEATSAQDASSDELREAWANAYGRNGNPSDAWDHAIKSLEAALTPVVVPNKDKATLGNVLGELRANQGSKWRSCFPGKDDDHSVEPLLKTLEQIWPNIDRHQGGGSRPPTEAEARSVVALTAALIQTHRESPLVYKV